MVKSLPSFALLFLFVLAFGWGVKTLTKDPEMVRAPSSSHEPVKLVPEAVVGGPRLNVPEEDPEEKMTDQSIPRAPAVPFEPLEIEPWNETSLDQNQDEKTHPSADR